METLESAPRESQSLRQRIAELMDSDKNPPEVLARIRDSLARLSSEGVAPGLQINQRVPDFTLPNAIGMDVSLHERLRHGAVVLKFYRGAWCPICRTDLDDLQRWCPEIKRAGASLMAISPQEPDDCMSLMDKLSLEFDLLSDLSQSVIEDYRVRFTLPEEIQEICRTHYGLDLTERTANGTWDLPIPATFIIDSGGIVRARHVEMDYTQRMEPSEIVDVLRGL